jgi:hypothetical protein
MGLESQLCTLHHLDDKMRMFRAGGKIAVHLARYVHSRPTVHEMC